MSHSLFSPAVATEFTGNIKLMEKSKDRDRPIGDGRVELIPITETTVLAECTRAHTRACGDSRLLHMTETLARDVGLDKFPFLRKYL